MFLYMAGAINNDVIAALSGAAVLYACVRLLHSPAGLSWRWGLALGGLYGLALMSKFNLAAVLLIIEVTVTWVAWKRRQWRAWLVLNILLVVAASAVSGWWFARNVALYGEPTGFVEVTELWGVRNPLDSFGLAVSEMPYAWTTLWGRFGFGQIPLPQIISDGLLWLTLGGLAGAGVGFVRGRSGRFGLFLLALNVVLFLAVLFNYMLVSPAGPNGRFFFPGLAALAVLLAYGLGEMAGFLRQRRRGVEAQRNGMGQPGLFWPGGFSLGMVGLALVALFGYLAPAYARPPAIEAETVIANPLNVKFDGMATLLGYEVDRTAVQPGGYLDLDLYWQVDGRPPGDYYLFVHLVDEAGTIVAQRDTHPGLGRFPTSQWRPGDRFVDSIRLHLPETAYAPAAATLSMGLYAPGGFRLGLISPDGQELGDALTLTAIEIESRESPYPNPQEQNFNNEIRLIGYEYNARVVQTGDVLTLTLFWEAIQEAPADYIVQVRLLDDQGNILAAADNRPVPATAAWKAGQIVEDRHQLLIGEQISPGFYAIDIALLDAKTNQRQNIVGEDGHWIDNHLRLAKVQVRVQAEK
jgi:hypothetical protein